MSVGQEVVLSNGEQGATVIRREETALGVITRTEIESMYLYAKHNPRSESEFIQKTLELCTMNEDIASECLFSVPRGNKTVEGPSARFAEIIFSQYRNVQVSSRIVSENDKEVVAMATFIDLETNAKRTADVSRSIVDKYGRKYNDDMIRNTKNAACSIADRNAIFKGIPKALWIGPWKESRKVAIGDVKTLVNKRADMIAYFAKMGISEEMIFATLEVKGIEDIGLDELARLKAMANSLKEGDSTPEEMFIMPEKVEKTTKGTGGLKAKIQEKKADPKKDPEPEKEPEPVKEKEKEEVPFPEPEPEKKAPEVDPGSTKSEPAGAVSSIIKAITEILRKSHNKTELDQAWKREVEGGNLDKIDKKRLQYVYAEVFERVTKE